MLPNLPIDNEFVTMHLTLYINCESQLCFQSQIHTCKNERTLEAKKRGLTQKYFIFCKIEMLQNIRKHENGHLYITLS